MGSKAIPIVVGVGEFKNPSKKWEDGIEPKDMMLRAIDRAFKDTKLFSSVQEMLRSYVDSVDVVQNWTWPYQDLPQLLAKEQGCNVTHTAEYPSGGNAPTMALDEAARRIANRTCRAAIVTGGESIASRDACEKAGKMPPPGWTKVETVKAPISPKTMIYPPGLSAAHQIGRPTQIYPMYEIALAAHRGQTLAQNRQESAELYGELAAIAAKNPYAWSYGKPPETAESIGTVTQRNRMISLPYPLLMNGLNSVNLSAAVILTSTECAEKLGIPEKHWIYVLGGAGTADKSLMWERPNFYSAPCISRSLDAALEVSHLKAEDIDLFDIYSCFPIIPKLAALHLGLPPVGGPKPLSLIGSMTAFGGAGNNFSMHGINEMVRQLRRGRRGRHGLVLGNGGNVTYQYAVVLSSQPPPTGHEYPAKNPLPEVLAESGPPIQDVAEGLASIETYTVEFSRTGTPESALIIGILASNGHRFVANHADKSTLEELASTSDLQVGRNGHVAPDPSKPGRNIFTLQPAPGLKANGRLLASL